MLAVYKAMEGKNKKRFVVGVEGESKADVLKFAKQKFHCKTEDVLLKQITITDAVVVDGKGLCMAAPSFRKRVWSACYRKQKGEKDVRKNK